LGQTTVAPGPGRVDHRLRQREQRLALPFTGSTWVAGSTATP
jgi:hypothetical protein